MKKSDFKFNSSRFKLALIPSWDLGWTCIIHPVQMLFTQDPNLILYIKGKGKSIILFGKENLYNSIQYQFLTKENKMDGIQVKINS